VAIELEFSLGAAGLFSGCRRIAPGYLVVRDLGFDYEVAMVVVRVPPPPVYWNHKLSENFLPKS
jgi:hypothetical protein